ncbi:DNA repair exonuclease [soil metagenome]
MKILCTADLHMGRRPSRLPSHIDSGELSSTRCWAVIVDTAIEERVNLIALSGDIVDQANRYYEAVGPFEEGVKRLAGAGIRVVAVAGNHDHETLVAIARNFAPEVFTLIGRGGNWERVTIERDGQPVLHVDGWSFPQASYTDDPLREYRPAPSGGVPVLGLLHGDLDAAASRYAPVRLADLRSHPAALWLLGHVHAPALREEEEQVTVLYPGSPQAMDPGEAGWHGVWIAEIDGAKRFSLRRVPITTVRYDSVEVDVGGEQSMGDVDARVSNAVRNHLRETLESGCGPLRYLSLRLRMVGRSTLHGELSRRMPQIVSELEMTEGGIVALVEQIEVATRPAFDLAELARGSDAPAIVARLALAIEAGELDADQEALLQSATRAASEVSGTRAYRQIQDDQSGGATSGAAVRQFLHEHSLLLLDSLLAQKEVVR